MAKLALYFSALLVLLMTANSSFALMPCCTEYHESPIGFKHLKNYTIQEVTGYCNIKAVIFQLLKGKFACTNADKPWVKKAVVYLQKKL
ncbi:C-C motif chemokine 20 [Melanotaenia boesemani]|uniref:C-C motif chemokine 20 n=1 Tax=Melanotaenia boesemani TaxID=1250792 RepID=UPI001C03E7F5|nr:C-C motif chemokine 20 [Melanotaenia boesemani]